MTNQRVRISRLDHSYHGRTGTILRVFGAEKVEVKLDNGPSWIFFLRDLEPEEPVRCRFCRTGVGAACECV